MPRIGFQPTKFTPGEIIAQHWLFSCDAPDSIETAAEIERLAKMIDDHLAGKELEWKIVNQALSERGLGAFRSLTRAQLAVELRDSISETSRLRMALVRIGEKFDTRCPLSCKGTDIGGRYYHTHLCPIGIARDEYLAWLQRQPGPGAGKEQP